MEKMELTSIEQVKAAIHPLRQRIIQALGSGPATASEVARKVGVAANKAHYHVGVLEKAGLVKHVQTRMVGSVTEKYFDLTARDFELKVQRNPASLSEVSPVIQQELQELLADVRAASERGDDIPLHLSISRIQVDSDTKVKVESAINSLVTTLDRSLEKQPLSTYRLVTAWVPMRQGETE